MGAVSGLVLTGEGGVFVEIGVGVVVAPFVWEDPGDFGCCCCFDECGLVRWWGSGVHCYY